MKKKAVYPGTFDPVTNGHIDLIKRGMRLFDLLVVAVAANPQKPTLFTLDERIHFIKTATADLPSVRVEPFDTLLVDFLRQQHTHVVMRGVRAVSDFEYEFQMALMNRNLDAEMETVFLMPSEQYSYLSSRIIKEVAAYGGELKGLVPERVREGLRQRFEQSTRGEP